MSRPPLGKVAGVCGAAAGVLAAGAAAGLAAERYLVRRPLRRHAAQAGQFGVRDTTPLTVLADDGVELRVDVDEPGHAKAACPDADPETEQVTVIFTHGYSLNRHCWHYQAQGLAGTARLAFWDHRGHGDSGRSEQRPTIEQLGSDLLRVLEAVAPTGPVVLVGHSMGGMTIMALADQHPELFGDRVAGVALISTSAGGLGEVTLGVPAYTSQLFHQLAPRVITALRTRPALAERGRRVATDLHYLLTKRYSFASQVPAELAYFTSQMLEGTPIEVVADFYPVFADHDKLAALPVLQHVETLVLVGARDLLTPARHSDDIVRAVPGAELVVVPRSGHMVILEHPETVNGHLRELIARAVRTAGMSEGPAA
ncbi:MAG: alpha/beta fold hydrolase [Carbonactinosporaceae bacterium]